MKIKLFNRVFNSVYNFPKKEEQEFDEFITFLYKAYAANVVNLMNCNNTIFELKSKSKLASKNISEDVFDDLDFVALTTLTLAMCEENNSYFVNGRIDDEYLEIANRGATERIKMIKSIFNNIINSNKILYKKYYQMIQMDLNKKDSIMELISLSAAYYLSGDFILKSLAINFIDSMCDVLSEYSIMSKEYVSHEIRFFNTLEYVCKQIKNNKPVTYDQIRILYDVRARINIDLEKTLSKDVMDEYNRRIQSKDIKPYNLTEEITLVYETLEKILLMMEKTSLIISQLEKKFKSIDNANDISKLRPSDFDNTKKLAIYLSEASFDYIKNGNVSKDYFDEILEKDNVNFEILMIQLTAHVSDYFFEIKNIESREYEQKLLSDLNALKNINELFVLLKTYFNSDNERLNKISYNILKILVRIFKSSLVNQLEKIDDLKKTAKCLKNIYDSLKNNKKINQSDIDDLLDCDFRPVILPEAEVFKYNLRITNIEEEKQKKIEALLESNEKHIDVLPSSTFDEAKIELNEDDLDVLDMYLDIVTDVANGIISINDFEDKTANYLDYVEGTHYKQILEELIREVQNDTNIPSSIKKKSKKAINGLIRTI